MNRERVAQSIERMRRWIDLLGLVGLVLLWGTRAHALSASDRGLTSPEQLKREVGMNHVLPMLLLLMVVPPGRGHATRGAFIEKAENVIQFGRPLNKTFHRHDILPERGSDLGFSTAGGFLITVQVRDEYTLDATAVIENTSSCQMIFNGVFKYNDEILRYMDLGPGVRVGPGERREVRGEISFSEDKEPPGARFTFTPEGQLSECSE